MPNLPHQEITRLLVEVSGGKNEAVDRLLPLVYGELRQIARRHLKGERARHTLDSVALVNEAYLKLVGNEAVEWENRAHFFGIAARAMRTVLIDYARSRNALKRGGKDRPVALTDVENLLAEEQAEHLLALDDALKRLAEANAEAGQIVEYRYFGGLTLEEAASLMNLSFATARRRWDFAKAWLKRELATPLPT